MWMYDLGFSVDYPTAPAVAKGVVYIGSGSKLFAMNASTGAFVWQHNLSDSDGGYTSPAVANGVLYIEFFYPPPHEDQDGISAMDAATGMPLWQDNVTFGFTGDSPAIANGVVYANNGTVYAFSLPNH